MKIENKIDPVKNIPLLMVSVYKIISENKCETPNDELKDRVVAEIGIDQVSGILINKKNYFKKQLRVAEKLLAKKGAVGQLKSRAWKKGTDYFECPNLQVDDIIEIFLTGGSGYEPICGVITKNTEKTLSEKMQQMDESNLQKFCTRIINHCVFEKTWKIENFDELPYPKYTLKYFPEMGAIRFKFECRLNDDASSTNKLIDEFLQNDLYKNADYMLLVVAKDIDEEAKLSLLKMNIIVIDLHLLVNFCISNDIGFYRIHNTYQIDQEYFKRYIK